MILNCKESLNLQTASYENTRGQCDGCRVSNNSLLSGVNQNHRGDKTNILYRYSNPNPKNLVLIFRSQVLSQLSTSAVKLCYYYTIKYFPRKHIYNFLSKTLKLCLYLTERKWELQLIFRQEKLLYFQKEGIPKERSIFIAKG